MYLKILIYRELNFTSTIQTKQVRRKSEEEHVWSGLRASRGNKGVNDTSAADSNERALK
jgi:hypothetical protein